MNVTHQTAADSSSSEALGMQAQPWSLPIVTGPSVTRRFRPTLGELEEIEKIAWEEAYEKGYAAGMNAAQQDIQQRVHALDEQGRMYAGLIQTLAAPLEQLDDDIESQLVSLSTAIARHLLRRELTIDPSQVLAVVRETVGLLPLAQRHLRVHLHPPDAAIVRDRLAPSQADTETAWVLVEDPMMTRGGCRVVTESSQIDARLETRLGAVLKHLLNEGVTAESRRALMTDHDDSQEDPT